MKNQNIYEKSKRKLSLKKVKKTLAIFGMSDIIILFAADSG